MLDFCPYDVDGDRFEDGHDDHGNCDEDVHSSILSDKVKEV